MTDLFEDNTEGSMVSHLCTAYEIEMARIRLKQMLDLNESNRTVSDEDRTARKAILGLAIELLRADRDLYLHNMVQKYAWHYKANFTDGVPGGIVRHD